jgi:septum formation protein
MLLNGNYRIVLASQSPRRRQLLEQAGLPFVVRAREVDESYPDDMPAHEVPVYLAQKKAAAMHEFLEHPDDILLTADSVVILDGTIYGKPTDADDARNILSQLSGRTHQVITGVCLTTAETTIAFGDLTLVTFATISAEEIEHYIHQYQPYDKAGAYAIQEWIGLCKIEKIEGTYANVMGLPVQRVWKALEQLRP